MIDDNKNHAEGLTELLNLSGFDCTSVWSGADDIDNYTADAGRMSYAVQELAGVPLPSTNVSKVVLGPEILPLSLDVKPNLPGLPVTLDGGTLTLSRAGLSDSFRQLMDKNALVYKLNRALLNLGPMPLKNARLGDFRLDKLSVRLDDHGPNRFQYNARFRNALIDTLADGDDVDTLITVAADGSMSDAAAIPAAWIRMIDLDQCFTHEEA
jgi:hypothetical protein